MGGYVRYYTIIYIKMNLKKKTPKNDHFQFVCIYGNKNKKSQNTIFQKLFKYLKIFLTIWTK